jgi:hypothetical protein
VARGRSGQVEALGREGASGSFEEASEREGARASFEEVSGREAALVNSCEELRRSGLRRGGLGFRRCAG